MNASTQLLHAAQADGLWPAEDSGANAASPPSWIVMSLGYLGALLVALLSVALLALLSWGKIFSVPGAFLTALAFTGGAIALMRSTHSMFWEQLAFSLLLVGQAMWLVGWGLSWRNVASLGLALPLLSLLALQLLAAWLAHAIWIMQLLGMLAAYTFLALPLFTHGPDEAMDALLTLSAPAPGNHWVLTLLWALWCTTQTRWSARPWALRASALADGIGVTLVLQPMLEYTLSLAGLGSSRFLLQHAEALQAGASLFHFYPGMLVRMAIILTCMAWLVLRHWPRSAWPGMQSTWPLLATSATALLLACWFVPLETVAAVGIISLGTGRRRLLWLSLAALLFQLANFYYLLHWSLLDKAYVLLASGAGMAAVLAGLHWRARLAEYPRRSTATPAQAPRQACWTRWAMLAAALLAVGLIHWDARQKEQIIAQGQKIFVPLAPVDPRSLLQGDYMALNFAFPPAVTTELTQMRQNRLSTAQHVVARRNALGVVQLLRLARPAEPLASDELLLPIKYLKGHWTLVTDAYFFPEGQGAHFSAARFGELRALPDGKALLVGLADQQLQAIAPLAQVPARDTPLRQ